MIVDSHVHIWTLEPDRYPWYPVGGYIPEREAPLSALLQTMDRAGVDRAVLVQPTPYGWDNSYLLDSATEHPDRLRVVGLVNPFSPDAPVSLTDLVRLRAMRGLRLNWNLSPLEMWRKDRLQAELWSTCETLQIPICIQMTPQYLELAHTVARCYPGARIVFDHLARPPIPAEPAARPYSRFLELGRYPNCYAKLSGLYYYSAEQLPYSDTWPLLRAAVQAFGASRCLWGSDFPFVSERWDYAQALETVQNRLGLKEADLDWILGLTAESLWWS